LKKVNLSLAEDNNPLPSLMINNKNRGSVSIRTAAGTRLKLNGNYSTLGGGRLSETSTA
jgi:hypothetical protein